MEESNLSKTVSHSTMNPSTVKQNKSSGSSEERELSFHSILSRLIDRIYQKNGQNTRRIILKAYFGQTAKQRRSLTLEALGKVEGLKKPVSRERARQIIKQFKEVFSREVKNLDGPGSLGIHAEANKADLQALRSTINSIINEIETFPRPIFTNRMQPRLKRLGLVDDSTYLPVVIELAEALSVQMTFDLYERDGYRIAIDKDHDFEEYTSSLITYAAKRATHNGGVFPVDAIADTSWDPKAPKCLQTIDIDIRQKYIRDLISFRNGMFLQDGKFFAFRDRDERLTTILIPIFKAYSTSLKKDVLFSAVEGCLKHRLMCKKSDAVRARELDILAQSLDAFDEFCRRTQLLDAPTEGLRTPGQALLPMLVTFEPQEIIKTQMALVRLIKANGKPVSSTDFGKLVSDEVQAPASFKSSLFTYPTLYYKEGKGRRHNYYKTLDGLYSVEEVSTEYDWSKANQSTTVELRGNAELDALKAQIVKLQNDLAKLSVRKQSVGQVRKEQRLLRTYLLASTSQAPNAKNLTGQCQICQNHFPADLLVAAHVKKREDCTEKEKADITNIAMLQCRSCDSFYENFFIYLNDAGIVVVNEAAPTTEDLKRILEKLAGNVSCYANGSRERLSYLRYHREKAFAASISYSYPESPLDE